MSDMSNQPLSAQDIENLVEDGPTPVHYLGRTEVAHYLGLAGLQSLTGVELPPPDVIVGDRKGWKKETIDAWNAQRPGRGRWGPRNPPVEGEDYWYGRLNKT
jgi:hypothetical protein